LAGPVSCGVHFSSLAFVVFLPCVYLAYWALGRRAQNLLLLGASYLFYGWWDYRFLGLIVLSSAVDYAAGRGIRAAQSPGAKKRWLALSLLMNLGALGVFKYLGFGVASFAALLEQLGVQAHLPTLRLVLPVGISFYTFQTLSYTIDVYRGRLEASERPLDFFTFVAFFPQLVAGPIERASALLPQIAQVRSFDATRAADGARQMLYGYLLKLVLADNLAPLVDQAFADPAQAGAWGLTWGSYAFAFQIYGDFAGYSHIAIGCARLFGIDLRRNFAYPYFSGDLVEFWRRWHMSLSTWFRDYVYVPLGGSRVTDARRRANVVLTFVLSGIWHGAGLNFVLWGLLHGVLVAAQGKRAPSDLDQPGGEGWSWWRALLTFHLVVALWVLFRAPNLGVAAEVWARILRDIWSDPFVGPPLIPLLLVLACLGWEWLQRRRPHGFDLAHLPRPLRWVIYLGAVLALAALGGVHQVPFIYFQF